MGLPAKLLTFCPVIFPTTKTCFSLIETADEESIAVPPAVLKNF
jgi:hypothetical protein